MVPTPDLCAILPKGQCMLKKSRISLCCDYLAKPWGVGGNGGAVLELLHQL